MADVKEVKNFTPKEKGVMLKALGALRASIVRAKTKDINDPDLVAVRDKQIAEIDMIVNHDFYRG